MAAATRIETAAPISAALTSSERRGLEVLRKDEPRARAILQETMTTRDSSYVARAAAAFGLYLLDPTEVDTVVQVLIAQIRRQGFANVRFAQSLIIAIGPPAVPELSRHLNDPMVLAVLGAMESSARAAVPALKAVVGEHNVEVASTLASIGTPEAVQAAKPVLLRALDDPYSQHLKMALNGIGKLGAAARDAIPRLRRLLDHSNYDVRLYAATTLADVGDHPAAAEALGKLATDTALHNRHLAVARLEQMGPRARVAVPQLLQLVRAADPDRYGERAAAAAALTQIDPTNPEVRQALQAASKDPRVRSELDRRGIKPP